MRHEVQHRSLMKHFQKGEYKQNKGKLKKDTYARLYLEQRLQIVDDELALFVVVGEQEYGFKEAAGHKIVTVCITAARCLGCFHGQNLAEQID